MRQRSSWKAREQHAAGLFLSLALVVAACGGGDGKGSPVLGSGGTAMGGRTATASGGNAPSGGAVATGGSASTGGAVTTGGSASSGGAVATGGKASSGGTVAAGGSASSGGAVAGGTTGTGGVAGAGGASAKGGTSGGASGGVSGGAGGASSGGSGGSSDSVNAVAMVKAMGFGTNIGNTFDNTTSWETGWGQPLVTQAYIKGMASRGIKTVRVPVAWDTYAKNGVIDAAKLSRVKEVVSWILAAGMYAIVNIHWDGGWIFNENKSNAFTFTDDVKAKFASYWKQISAGFTEVGHLLIFEGINEEARFFINGDQNGTPDIAALNQLNQLFVTTIRAQSGFNATRALLISGFNTDINKTCVDAFTVPNDPAGAGRLFLSIHFYDPYPFTLMEDPASWGSPSATWGTDAEKKALTDQFDKLGTFSTKKGIPVILGEFAVTRGQKVVRQSASRTLWMQSVAKAMMAHGGVPVLWDTGSEISRSDGSFSSELQAVMNDLK